MIGQYGYTHILRITPLPQNGYTQALRINTRYPNMATPRLWGTISYRMLLLKYTVVVKLTTDLKTLTNIFIKSLSTLKHYSFWDVVCNTGTDSTKTSKTDINYVDFNAIYVRTSFRTIVEFHPHVRKPNQNLQDKFVPDSMRITSLMLPLCGQFGLISPIFKYLDYRLMG